MTVTAKSILIALSLAAVSIIAYIYASLLHTENKRDLSQIPTFISEDSVSMLYGDNGKLTRSIAALKIWYFDKDQRFIFQKPIIKSYDYENGVQQIWRISGDKGSLITGKTARIDGNVLLIPEFKDSQLKKATADRIDYDLKDNTLFAPEEDTVVIYGENWQTSGKKFFMDINTKNITYKGDSHATYYPGN